jgi:hypothetical protein
LRLTDASLMLSCRARSTCLAPSMHAPWSTIDTSRRG